MGCQQEFAFQGLPQVDAMLLFPLFIEELVPAFALSVILPSNIYFIPTLLVFSPLLVGKMPTEIPQRCHFVHVLWNSLVSEEFSTRSALRLHFLGQHYYFFPVSGLLWKTWTSSARATGHSYEFKVCRLPTLLLISPSDHLC